MATVLGAAMGYSFRRLRLHQSAASVEAIEFACETTELTAPDDQAVVEIACAGVNPSDVKAAIGMMPYAVWPRTPGRDFAGTVVAGPSHLIGEQVWGSSGDLGVRCDGTHATHLVLNAACLAPKPSTVSLAEAGAVGVPFVTAWLGFTRSGMPGPGDTVLIFGANGNVGQAAIQIATMLGARVIGVARGDEGYIGHAKAAPEMIASDRSDVVSAVREVTEGKGANLIFNTVGSPYFDVASDCLAKGGCQILIGTIERTVPFDILKFYRGEHRYIGLDTLSLSTETTIGLLKTMTPHFEAADLRPFPIDDAGIFGLGDAASAYARVMKATRGRTVLFPQ